MHRRRFLQWTVAAMGMAAAVYPLWIEHQLVRVSRVAIRLATLPFAFHGFRIVHLSDLHFGPMTGVGFVAGLVRRINDLRADLIVCTGDYVRSRESSEEIETVWPLLLGLKARDGVCAVLGNHDHWADTARSLEWLAQSGYGVRHGCRVITRGRQRLAIGGAGDLWEDELGIDRAFAQSDDTDCRILLSHNPDSADTPFVTPVALILSGHTHGGQVAFPFFGPPLLPVRNKRYASGLVATGHGPMYISRGLGWALAPVRCNCPPEIAVLELLADKPAEKEDGR